MDSDHNPDNVFNILVASDVHLGYGEKDPIRGDDSFNTFEEILQLADQREVDLILLGGDLFHDNKPSPQCIHRCMTLLRRYCLGDRPVAVEFLSDQAENFQHCMNPVVNYEDPNLNISIPVYSIHGNHDDPSGFGRIATLDLLSASGLINYFGKWTDLTQIHISPLLLQKGTSRLAIYGLSYIKDERLSRLYKDRKVTMLRPKEYVEDWFNIMVLHQNRVMRGAKNYVPETAIDKFVDLVIWGHEHECRVDPELNPEQGFYVIQPGSPVATSLCEGEAVEKFVTILNIHKKEFNVEKIKLKTVRPFVMDSLNLSNCTLNRTDGLLSDEVQLYLTERVEDLVRRSQDQLTGHRKQPTLPLIRLRVTYSEEMEYFNPIRFGQQFSDKVANPMDMILLKRERKEKKVKSEDLLDKDAIRNTIDNDEEAVGDEWGSRAETVVERYFSEGGDAKQLRVLSVRGLAEAVKRFIDKGDNDAISDITNYQIKKTIKYIQDKKIVADEDTVTEEIENFRLHRLNRSEEETRDAETVLDNRNRNATNGNAEATIVSDSDSDGPGTNGNVPKTTLPSTSRGGRGAARGRGRGSRGSSNSPARGRGSRGGRGARGANSSGNIKEALAVQRTSSRAKPSKVMYISDESD
ncbi:Double-strand break repair protein mre11a [Homalodisca vitripennis]|nr:Double-strand break repair protein mre11a [Homalodisca vitripennis]